MADFPVDQSIMLIEDEFTFLRCPECGCLIEGWEYNATHQFHGYDGSLGFGGWECIYRPCGHERAGFRTSREDHR